MAVQRDSQAAISGTADATAALRSAMVDDSDQDLLMNGRRW